MVEDKDEEIAKRFHKALRSIGENDSRHNVPDFLKQGIDPHKEFEKIKHEVENEVIKKRSKVRV